MHDHKMAALCPSHLIIVYMQENYKLINILRDFAFLTFDMF